LGKRLLRTCIVVAEDTTNASAIAGLLCMHELIWENNNILPDEESENVLRNAVSLIGPKDRRLYKDATAIDIAAKLLPRSYKAVCVFSNLAVSPTVRRQGVGEKICQAAETVAKEWGYEYLHLKVEAENTGAAKLYQNKLGYILEENLPADPAIRLDLKAASFVETTVATLILSKNLQ
jgi:GNAT superfamily N-acetyltransferase